VLDAFTVRKEAKGHGARRLIEGNFVPGSSVVIVEVAGAPAKTR